MQQPKAVDPERFGSLGLAFSAVGLQGDETVICCIRVLKFPRFKEEIRMAVSSTRTQSLLP